MESVFSVSAVCICHVLHSDFNKKCSIIIEYIITRSATWKFYVYNKYPIDEVNSICRAIRLMLRSKWSTGLYMATRVNKKAILLYKKELYVKCDIL